MQSVVVAAAVVVVTVVAVLFEAVHAVPQPEMFEQPGVAVQSYDL